MMPGWIALPASLAMLAILGDGTRRLIAGAPLPLFWYERGALAWLLGTGAATVVWVLLQPAYTWVPPIPVITAVAALVAVAKMGSGGISAEELAAAPRRPLPAEIPRDPISRIDAALGIVVVAQIAALFAAAMWSTLGWDGLFNFELKARLALEHAPAGQLPAAYFGDPTRGWSHPQYPMLVPFTEFWVYAWLGHVDQAAVKIVFPIFFCSLVALVCGTVTRVASRRWALATAIALGCIPGFTVLPGAASGYADVPLAAAIGGAACLTFLALRTGVAGYIDIAAALLAVAVWTKAEGTILAAAIGVAAMVAARTINRRRASVLLWVPAVALAPWHAALAMYGAVGTGDFRMLAPEEFVNALGTLAVVLPMIARELCRPGHWGLIWPAFFGAVFLMIAARRSTGADWFLVSAVVVPLNVYAMVYLFSAWPDVREHVGFSLPRLLVPLAPIATLFIVTRAAADLRVDGSTWA